MSHLALQAPIFSPSVARAAASTAKDWAYVDNWLRRKYTLLRHSQNPVESGTGHKYNAAAKPAVPPTFERNADTLEALLTLIAANEAADEERRRLAVIEEFALREVHAAEEEKEGRRRIQVQAQSGGNAAEDATAQIDGDLLAEDLLHSIDEGLPKEGQAALDAMADVAVALESADDASPAHLAHRFVELQGRAHEVGQLLHRVEMLQSYLDADSARLSLLLEQLRLGRSYQLPPDVDQENRELGRTVKNTATSLPELTRRVESLEKTVGVPPLTVEDVRADEEAYLDLLARKKNLDAQVKAFAGLPPDIEAARAELEVLRAQLRDATEQRDANFEMLVERESPVKVRNSRRR
ncbi:hypothetical protein GGS20DRAFT_432414 [Poronia punctata]|nr:hypothetical protein GGS20DRAFT_432414 [Poronia punctata]